MLSQKHLYYKKKTLNILCFMCKTIVYFVSVYKNLIFYFTSRLCLYNLCFVRCLLITDNIDWQYYFGSETSHINKSIFTHSISLIFINSRKIIVWWKCISNTVPHLFVIFAVKCTRKNLQFFLCFIYIINTKNFRNLLNLAKL